MMRMALKSNPMILLTMMGTGWQLLRTGRMPLRMEKIDRIHELPRNGKGAKGVH